MKVLVATDGSPTAGAAGRFVAAMPLPAGSAVQVMTVADPVAWRMAEWAHAAQWEWGEKTVAQAAAQLAREGITVTTGFRQGPIVREILEAADQFAADLIAVGSRGLGGVAGFLLGSVARNVAHHARQPVLVARPLCSGLRAVVLGVDGSENASSAVDFAAALPLPADIEFQTVHVLPPLRSHEALAHRPDLSHHPEDLERREVRLRHDREAAARPFLDGAVKTLQQAGCRVSAAIRAGDPAQEILALADEACADLIITAARGKSVVERLVVGSVADRLLRHAPCSVLVVH